LPSRLSSAYAEVRHCQAHIDNAALWQLVHFGQPHPSALTDFSHCARSYGMNSGQKKMLHPSLIHGSGKSALEQSNKPDRRVALASSIQAIIRRLRK
jgi:hypothetical protein